MSGLTREEADSRVDDLYSRSEALEAEADARIDALQDYIAEEEAEIKALQYEALQLIVQARDLVGEYNLVD